MQIFFPFLIIIIIIKSSFSFFKIKYNRLYPSMVGRIDDWICICCIIKCGKRRRHSVLFMHFKFYFSRNNEKRWKSGQRFIFSGTRPIRVILKWSLNQSWKCYKLWSDLRVGMQDVQASGTSRMNWMPLYGTQHTLDIIEVMLHASLGGT